MPHARHAWRPDRAPARARLPAGKEEERQAKSSEKELEKQRKEEERKLKEQERKLKEAEREAEKKRKEDEAKAEAERNAQAKKRASITNFFGGKPPAAKPPTAGPVDGTTQSPSKSGATAAGASAAAADGGVTAASSPAKVGAAAEAEGAGPKQIWMRGGKRVVPFYIAEYTRLAARCVAAALRVTRLPASPATYPHRAPAPIPAPSRHAQA